MDAILLALRLILAAVFLLAGIGKLLDRKGSKKALSDFGVPRFLVGGLAVMLPVAEILVAAALIFVQTSWFGSVGAALLLSIFVIGMLVQYSKGNAPDCHCFGQIHSEPVGVRSIVRNAMLLAGALFLSTFGFGNQGQDIFSAPANKSANGNSMEIIIGITTVALLAAVVHFLRQISAQQVQIVRRIEMLEILSSGDKAREIENLSHPEDGLPIAAPAPDFVLPDTNAKKTALAELLQTGKTQLLFFVSSGCGPCGALLPEIEGWKSEMSDKFDFVFVSSGKTKENAEKFGKVADRILLQKEREIAELYGALWTPTLIIVNTDGTIGSRAAAGDGAIRNIIEKLKGDTETEKFYITNGDRPGISSKLGEVVPEFSVKDVKGRSVSSNELRGKRTLAAFWSTTCPHCVNMLDDLKRWEQEKGADQPQLIVFSEGDLQANLELDLSAPVILEKERSVASKLGMNGTPSAVLIDETGRIISETAVGADEIWSLVGRRKAAAKEANS